MGFVKSTFQKRSESNIANPKSWLLDLFGGGGTSVTGRVVTPEAAIYSIAVYACVKVLSETVASLPLPVYKREDKGKAREPSHPAYELLHNLPNPEMTSFTFRETMMAHLLLWGNGYAEIEWGADGYPKNLWLLPPWRVEPKRDRATKLIVYEVSLPDGGSIILPAYSVLHIPGFGFDGLKGKTPITIAREAIGMALATEEYGGRFFGNGAKPGGVLEHPGILGEDAAKNLRQSWNEMHSGLSNQHRIAILEEGMAYKQVGIPPEDAQFLETRKFQTEEIARFYRVPLHLIQSLDHATNNNIEHQSIDFVVHTVRPWLVRWEQTINWKLFTARERKAYFVEFLVDGLLRGDIKSRYDAYAVGRNNGWLSSNDIRAMENMNPIEGEGGDEYFLNGNMIPLNVAMKNTTRAIENNLKGGGNSERKRAAE